MGLANYRAFNYNEGDVSAKTFINIYRYQRPGPNAKLLKQPIGFVTLPLPDNLPQDEYSMNIGSADLNLGGALTNIQQTNSLTSLKNTIRERLGAGEGLGGDVASIATGLLAMVPSSVDFGLNVLETAQATAGVVRNPHTALLFNNVNLRTFNFRWRISPRNDQQSRNLDGIIKLLKQVMHPSLAVYGFVLDYPNLVTMNLTNGDKEGFVKVDYAFISDLSVNPVPNGYVNYRDNYPSIVDLSMTVKEIRIKTAEDFGGGSMSVDAPGAAARDTSRSSQFNGGRES